MIVVVFSGELGNFLTSVLLPVLLDSLKFDESIIKGILGVAFILLSLAFTRDFMGDGVV